MHDETGHNSRDEGSRSPVVFRVDDADPGDSFLKELAWQGPRQPGPGAGTPERG